MTTNGLPRRRRTVALIAALAMLLTVVAPPEADAQAERQHDETLRLSCAADSIEGRRGVLCRWSEATDPDTRGYRLFRSTDGGGRQPVASVGVDGRRAHFDTDVSAPSELVYAVVSVDRVGRKLGQSEPVHVGFGTDVAALRLHCAADSVEGERGILCRWSSTDHPAARGYLLYRIVDRNARELVARVGVDGRLGHLDTDVSAGSVHLYGVVAVDGDGSVLAIGGPVRIAWPTGS